MHHGKINCPCDLYGSRRFGMAMILSCSRTFLLILVSEVGQTYQQNGRKLRAEVFQAQQNFKSISTWYRS